MVCAYLMVRIPPICRVSPGCCIPYGVCAIGGIQHTAEPAQLERRDPIESQHLCCFPRKTKNLATQKFGCGPDPCMHVYMCTDNVFTWSRRSTASCFLPGMPSQAKTKLRGTKHEISPPLLSIECIRYLHSTLPFKPVVPSNSNVSHISILFPGIFFPW